MYSSLSPSFILDRGATTEEWDGKCTIKRVTTEAKLTPKITIHKKKSGSGQSAISAKKIY